jgi:hypothetical protein
VPQVEALIAQIWDRAGFKDGFSPYLREDGEIAFDNLISLYKQFSDWTEMVATGFQYAMLTKKGTPNEDLSCHYLMFCAIAAHSKAIHKLMESRIDVCARQILRSMREYIDVLGLFFVDESLVAVFRSAQTPEACNEFWNRSVRRNKARKKLQAKLEELAPESIEDVRAHEEWRRQEDSSLSLAVHPSFPACFGATLGSKFSLVSPDHHSEDAFFAPASRTLKYAIISILDLALAFNYYVLDQRQSPYEILKETDEMGIWERVEAGTRVLVSLAVFLGNNQDHPSLHIESVMNREDAP